MFSWNFWNCPQKCSKFFSEPSYQDAEKKGVCVPERGALPFLVVMRGNGRL